MLISRTLLPDELLKGTHPRQTVVVLASSTPPLVTSGVWSRFCCHILYI